MRRAVSTLLAAMVIVGCAVDEQPTKAMAPAQVEDVPEPQVSDVPEAQSKPESEPEPTGNRENPLPLGKQAPIEGYVVTVSDVVLNADQMMMDENLFNEPAENGRWVIVTLEGEFKGTEDYFEGDPGVDLSVTIVGSDSRQYTDFDNIGVPPDGLMEVPTLESGGKFKGNAVLDVPPEALDGASLFVESTFSFDNESRVYWEIPE